MSEMTSRQRLLAAVRGEDVDRLPWSPFLAYWWEHQSPEMQARGQFAFVRELGGDFLARGFVTPFKAVLPPDCEVRVDQKNGYTRTTHITPVGTLSTLQIYSPDGNTHFVIEHPLKTVDDFKILSYYFERLRFEPNYQPVQEGIQQVGEDGLCAPLIAAFGKSPFQSLLEHYAGTEELNYFLVDCPAEVEALLEVMSLRSMEAVRISVESPAEVFITWEDSSTTNVSPRQFKRYIASEMDRWGQVVHASGKYLLHHACGHLRALLPTMALEEIDMVESLPPPPTGDVEIWEAQPLLGKVGVIGGIEPVRFLQLNLEELSAYVEELLARVNPHRYILANSDSCPPGVSLAKFHRVTELVRAHKM